MEKYLRYLFLCLWGLLLFGGTPAEAEMCSTGESCCAREQQAVPFDYACYVNCKDPPGIEDKNLDTSSPPRLAVVVVEMLRHRERAPFTVDCDFAPPESIKPQLSLLLAQAWPNPPPAYFLSLV